jgi:zinc/manganese transport system permease protein
MCCSARFWLDNQALALIGSITAFTIVMLFIFWRGLIAECLDPLFLRSVSGLGAVVHFVFLFLVVLNLVSGFQALGTLLSVGLMMLPAAAARFWTARVETMCGVAIGLGVVSGVVGLLLSYHFSLPSGPSIILCAGVLYVGSLFFGRRGIVTSRLHPHRHRVA